MNKPYREHEDAVTERFRNDPALVAEYLNAVLEEGDQQEVMRAMRRIAEAFGVRMPGTTEDVLGNDVSTTSSPCPHGSRRHGD